MILILDGDCSSSYDALFDLQRRGHVRIITEQDLGNDNPRIISIEFLERLTTYTTRFAPELCLVVLGHHNGAGELKAPWICRSLCAKVVVVSNRELHPLLRAPYQKHEILQFATRSALNRDIHRWLPSSE